MGRGGAGRDLAPAAVGVVGLVRGVLEEAVAPAPGSVEGGPARHVGGEAGAARGPEVLDGGEVRAGEARLGRRTVHERAVHRLEVRQVGPEAVVVARERDAVVERQHPELVAELREGGEVGGAEAEGRRQRAVGEGVGRLGGGGGAEREVPHREVDVHALERRPGGRDRERAQVPARAGARRDEHLDPDALAHAADVEGEGVAVLVVELVHVRDERVRPRSGGRLRVGGGGALQGDRSPRGTAARRGGRRRIRGRQRCQRRRSAGSAPS